MPGWSLVRRASRSRRSLSAQVVASHRRSTASPPPPCVRCLDGSAARVRISSTVRKPDRTAESSANLSPVAVIAPKDLAASIRDIPDFPKPGILFKDITTMLKDGDSFKSAVDGLLAKIKGKPIDVVVGMESRGFIFGAPIAYALGVGFVPGRKLGKLPADVVTVEYDLEYGSATLQMHKDAMKPGSKGLIVPDRLATRV